MDIQIFDLIKCFDVLWVEDVMNDLYEALSNSGCNEKLALLYNLSLENHVSVKTAVGQTRRVNMPKIVMQGGSWGPIQCSNSIDKIGKDCEENRDHLYLYKNLVQVPVLSMVDDMLAFSNCGQESVALNTYINTHIELKKMKFHTPDSKGKTKCHKMHIGCKNSLCPDLRVHGTVMQPVLEDTYLGDVIRADGRNCSNVQSRVSKGIGIISQIMTILERVSFGRKYFKIAFSLREAMFLSGILTNAGIWYHLTKTDLEDLEKVDRILMRRILSLPESTSNEALYLESGCVDIDTVIKGKRVIYLQYLVKENKDNMLFKFFKAQWDRPGRGDWTSQVKGDLIDLDIPESLEYLEEMSINKFKTMVKKKTKQYALDKFEKLKAKHSKLDNIEYANLKLQEYLESSELSVEDCKVVMLWRLHMAKFRANYGDSKKKCPICGSHTDSQEEIFKNCEEIKKITLSCVYEDIFKKPTKELAQVLKQITKLKENSQDRK